jgi:hypothetical protein
MYHIALILLWRKLDGDPHATEVECTGAADNDRFFDWRNGSTEKADYINFKTRGWEPLTNANFVLPAGETTQCP